MNHTKTYGLSQWELTDEIRMEDFNADNARLEAALAALAAGGGGCKLLDATTGSGGIGFGSMCTGIEWDRWALVGCYVAAYGLAAGSGTEVTQYFYPYCNVTMTTKRPCGLFLLTPMKNGGNLVSGLFLSEEGPRFFQGNKSFRDLQMLSVDTSPGTDVGRNLCVWFGIG